MTFSSGSTMRVTLSMPFHSDWPRLGLWHQAPITRPTLVQWNLEVVLRYFHSKEPLLKVPYTDLAKKCFFLTALASGRRICELAHLGWDKPYCVFRSSDAVLCYPPDFLVRNETSQRSHPRLQLQQFPAQPPARSDFCPIRAI